MFNDNSLIWPCNVQVDLLGVSRTSRHLEPTLEFVPVLAIRFAILAGLLSRGGKLPPPRSQSPSNLLESGSLMCMSEERASL